MINPVFHDGDLPPDSHKDASEEVVVLEAMLLLEVLKHGAREGPDEEGEYLLEGDHPLPAIGLN